jgi:hypothetical protein
MLESMTWYFPRHALGLAWHGYGGQPFVSWRVLKWTGRRGGGSLAQAGVGCEVAPSLFYGGNIQEEPGVEEHVTSFQVRRVGNSP